MRQKRFLFCGKQKGVMFKNHCCAHFKLSRIYIDGPLCYQYADALLAGLLHATILPALDGVL